MKPIEQLPETLVAEYFDSVAEAQKEAQFEWATNTAFPAGVAAIWATCPAGGTTGLPGSIEVSAEHGEFIVRACNNHADLLSALVRLTAWVDSGFSETERRNALKEAHAAIEKAKPRLSGPVTDRD
jgi:hypothetical protein